MIKHGHDHGMTAIPTARTLVKADGSFELAYGAVVLVLLATSAVGGSDLTVSTGAAVGVATGFLAAGASQHIYFFRAPTRVLHELAIGNLGMGLAGLAWMIGSHGFTAAGVLVVSLGVTWKIAIGAVQLRSLRDRKPQARSA